MHVLKCCLFVVFDSPLEAVTYFTNYYDKLLQETEDHYISQ